MDVQDCVIEVMENGKEPKKVASEVTWMFRSSLTSVWGEGCFIEVKPFKLNLEYQ